PLQIQISPRETPNHFLTMGNWVVNHWLAVLCLVAWLGLNVFLFVHAFLKYEKDDKYYYTREILG
uniref:NADPH oxidase 1 n=1 Tax=Ictidomys tridecemlineatus TaxID=43179 RepID=A0A287DED6_ICTTR